MNLSVMTLIMMIYSWIVMDFKKQIQKDTPFRCYYCIELNQTKSKIKQTKTCELCSVSKSDFAFTTIHTNNKEEKVISKTNNKNNNIELKKKETVGPPKIIKKQKVVIKTEFNAIKCQNSMINLHDFKYSMSKCYCYECLHKQIIIKKE